MEHTYSLRPLKETDASRMLEWMRDENVTAYLRIGGADTKLRDVQDFIASAKDESLNLHRAIVDKNDTYLGTVSLKNIDHTKKQAEYAIAMHPDGMGCGAAAEGSRLILNTAFKKLGMTRIYLNVSPKNQRAIRFYEKNGWRRCEAVGEREKQLRWYAIYNA